MKKSLLIISSMLLVFSMASCGTSGFSKPNPKRMACQSSCDAVKDKAVKSCKKKKKSAAVCEKAGKVAYDKCVSECMSK